MRKLDSTLVQIKGLANLKVYVLETKMVNH